MMRLQHLKKFHSYLNIQAAGVQWIIVLMSSRFQMVQSDEEAKLWENKTEATKSPPTLITCNTSQQECDGPVYTVGHTVHVDGPF